MNSDIEYSDTRYKEGNLCQLTVDDVADMLRRSVLACLLYCHMSL